MQLDSRMTALYQAQKPVVWDGKQGRGIFSDVQEMLESVKTIFNFRLSN